MDNGIAVYIATSQKSADPDGKIGIQYNLKYQKTYVYLYNPISSLVVGDRFTIVGTTKYSNPDQIFNVVESGTSYVVIDNSSYVGDETSFPTQYPYINISFNSKNPQAGFSQVPVYITSINQSPNNHPIPDPTKSYLGIQDALGQNGFYYSNTSIIPALNTSYSNPDFYPDLSFSISDGYCLIQNSSKTATYTLNFSPENVGIDPPYFKTLGAMLGFNDFLYVLEPQSSASVPGCNVECAQISYCNQNGNIISEDKIDMNADEYIQLAIADWQNIYQQDGRDTYYSVFANIPITVPKGSMIYDIVYNNSVRKKYDLLQPENVRYLEIQLFDRLGYNLLMPNVEWQMTLELEEVLNSSLYEKLREI